MSFMLLGILNSQVSAAGGSYELISSQILTGSASSVTFSSIPSDFKHLQIRAVARTNRANTSDIMSIRINSDTGTNYADHLLKGTGAVASAAANTGRTYIGDIRLLGNNATANNFAGIAIDILDYANTSKNTTTRHFYGTTESFTEVGLGSGLWMNTAAVSSLTFLMAATGSSFVSGSRFSLYGVKG